MKMKTKKEKRNTEMIKTCEEIEQNIQKVRNGLYYMFAYNLIDSAEKNRITLPNTFLEMHKTTDYLEYVSGVANVMQQQILKKCLKNEDEIWEKLER